MRKFLEDALLNGLRALMGAAVFAVSYWVDRKLLNANPAWSAGESAAWAAAWYVGRLLDDRDEVQG